MATKVISTWEQFIASATESITEDTTYIITSDFDLSSSVFESGITWSGGGSYRKTYTTEDTSLDGAKKINGLTYYGGSYLFNFGSQNITFYNIHFTNCQITSGFLFYSAHYLVNAPILLFNRCIVTGFINILNHNYMNASGSDNQYWGTVFYQCAFNIKGTILSNYNGYHNWAIFTECWIHFDKLGNASNVIASHIFLCQCYIEGNIDLGSNNYLIQYYGTYNIVLNMNITTTASSNRYLFYQGSYTPRNDSSYPNYWYGTNYSIVNSSKLAQTWNDSTTTLTRLTDTQMKDVTAINTAAPNFPISL